MLSRRMERWLLGLGWSDVPLPLSRSCACPGDGTVSSEDMDLIIRQAGGSSLSNAEIKALVENVLNHAGAEERGLKFPEFKAALDGAPIDLHVQVPLE